MEMECASYIDILADKWRPLEWHIDVGRELQGFFTLLIGVPVLATQMQGVNEARQDEVPIGVFPLHGSSPPVELNRRFPIVTRELVLDDLDVMLERWFEQKEKLGPTRNLLFTVLRDPDILIENQLLMITQALERYHRVVNPGVYVDKDEYKNVYEKLVSAIPSDVAEPLRESLKSRIKFGNELSLRNRLSKLIQSLPEDFRKGLFRKEKEFIGRVVDMRNYLTHYPIGQEGQAPARMSFYEQTDAVQRLVVVLICLLLAELGLPDEKLRWIVRNILTHPRYSYLKVSG